MNELERLRRISVVTYNTWYTHYHECDVCGWSDLCAVGSVLYGETTKLTGQLRDKGAYWSQHGLAEGT